MLAKSVFLHTFVISYTVGKFLKTMLNKNSNTVENALLTLLAYPGVGIRYMIYGTKRPVRDLLEDGLDINVFSFLWLAGMVFTWSTILNKI